MPLETKKRSLLANKACHSLATNLHCTTSWFNRISAEWLAPYDLSPQQFTVLRILQKQHPQPSRVAQVREQMVDRMSNVSRLIEKLRQKGLVERHRCPADRRAVDLRITDAGLALLATLDDAEQAWLDNFKTLTPGEMTALNTLLQKLRG